MLSTRPVHTRIIYGAYAKVVKPFFFSFDPETIHDTLVSTGSFLGRFALTRALTAALFRYRHPMLEQTIRGIHFPVPVGLAAGFDKEGVLTDIMSSVGFGFMEIGSVTGRPHTGNAHPRLWRLPKSRGLVVNYGLKNDGCEVIAQRLSTKKKRLPWGISIAKTAILENDDTENGIKDYLKAYTTLYPIADYITINISCPNVDGGQPFCDPANLDLLLETIATNRLGDKPHFVKLSPDISKEQVKEIVKTAEKHGIDGFVCTNLTKPRENEYLLDTNVPKKGGMSGKVVDALSDSVIRTVYEETKGKKLIIGLGGVFTGADAYRKIRLGANLVQLLTGMIYEGPQAIGQINRDLVQLLKKDGFTSIGEAVGADLRT